MIVQLALLAMLQQGSPRPVAGSYLFFVALEGSDEVALLRFDGKAIRVEHRTPFGTLPGDPESPLEVYVTTIDTPAVPTFPDLNGRGVQLSSAHGFPADSLAIGPRHLAIAPDGVWYYVTTARGTPSGLLLKVRIAGVSGPVGQPPDSLRGQEALGADPVALRVTPDGAYAWVTTVPRDTAERSWISIVYLNTMLEVGRIPTCGGARGSRFTADGARHYSLCALTDALVEIDAKTMKVSRQLNLAGSDHRRCSPSALALVPDGSRIFVACRESNEAVEVDASSWSVRRRIAVGAGPDDIAVTPDGRTLVVSDAAGQAVSLVELATGGSETGPAAVMVSSDYRRGYVATSLPGGSRRVDLFDLTPMFIAAAGFGTPLPSMHGIPVALATSQDSRYAFVTVRRIDAELGTIEVIDLDRRVVVASLDFGRRLAGIAFWKSVD